MARPIQPDGNAMHSQSALAATAFLLVAAAPAASDLFSDEQRATAAALRDQALGSGDRTWRIVESLTMRTGPRLAGSAGDRAAVAWGLRTMRDAGFANVHVQPVTVPHWERGQLNVEVLEPFPHTLTATSLGGSVGTGDAGIQAPVVAVMDIDDLKTRHRSGIEGKIVYFKQRTARTRDGSGYAAAVLVRRDGPAEAARLGAVAVVIRSIGTSNTRMAHTGMTRYQDDAPRIPAIAVSNADADIIDYALANSHQATLRVFSTARELPPALSANVIGEIPGREPEAGLVLLAAHLDSWDVGTGAIDDGAGVGIILETARMISALAEPPRRTIRIVLYANEEFGLSGAKTYANMQQSDLKRHIVGLEADSGGYPVWLFASRVAEDKHPLVTSIFNVIEPLGIELGDNETGSGADLSPLRKLGMPILTLRQDASRYFDFHHTDSDTIDKVDVEELNQALAAFVAVTYLAAEANSTFGWLPEEPTEP